MESAASDTPMKGFPARWLRSPPPLRSMPLRVAVVATAGLAGFLALTDHARAQEAYRIAIGDELTLDFLDDDKEPHPLKVGFRGDVQVPFLGAVQVANLTLAEARDQIAESYVANQIFLAPPVELSVVNLRPLAVLGDVTSPGFHDYRSFITVEQAVGLAGGPISPANNEEDRSLERASLRGQIASLDSGLAREIIAAARLDAQLGATAEIEIPDIAGRYQSRTQEPATLEADLLERLRMEETAIMAAEQRNHERQAVSLDSEITEVQAEIDLTSEQITIQEDRIKTYAHELAVSLSLTEQGLQALPVRARLERQVADEERALLALRASKTQMRRALTMLQREREALDFERHQAWRIELGDRQVAIAQLIAQREGMVNQLNLLADWTARMADGQEEIQLDYRLRRRSSDGMETIEVEAIDELVPGDVLLVKVVIPGAFDEQPSQ